MARTTARIAPKTRATMRRWIPGRDINAITCQLNARGHRCYELCVLPHWNPSSAVIEWFDAPAPALLRHAEIASRLREHGWMVIDHVAADSTPAAS